MPNDRGGIDGHEPKVNDMNTFWRLSAPLLTALFLMPHASAQPLGSAPELVGAYVGGAFDFYCSGTIHYKASSTTFRAALFEAGPIKILPVTYKRWSVVGLWSYTCKAREYFQAYGFGGVLREVELQHDRDRDGHYETLARCSYISGSCEARYVQNAETVRSETGFATGTSYMPAYVTGCVDRWLRVTNTQSPVPGTFLDVRLQEQSKICRTAAVSWTADYGYSFPMPSPPSPAGILGSLPKPGGI